MVRNEVVELDERKKMKAAHAENKTSVVDRTGNILSLNMAKGEESDCMQRRREARRSG